MGEFYKFPRIDGLPQLLVKVAGDEDHLEPSGDLTVSSS
jgi:hypothetical protein